MGIGVVGGAGFEKVEVRGGISRSHRVMVVRAARIVYVCGMECLKTGCGGGC